MLRSYKWDGLDGYMRKTSCVAVMAFLAKKIGVTRFSHVWLDGWDGKGTNFHTCCYFRFFTFFTEHPVLYSKIRFSDFIFCFSIL